MTDDQTPTPLTAKDEADLELLGDTEEPTKRTLLETWRNVLGNIESSAEEKVTPVIANRLVSNWPRLSFQEVPRYHEIYHELLLELRHVLDEVVQEFPDCLKNVDEDAIDNRKVYEELLFRWQLTVAAWEHRWDAADPESHIKLAAISDAAAYYIGQQGLVEHLNLINFAFTDEDRDALGQRLLAAKEEL